MANAKVSVGSVPAEANSGGSLNELPPADQIDAKGKSPKTEGPQVHETGAYLPAEYETLPGIVRRDR